LFGLSTARDDRRGHFPGVSDWPLAIQQARQSVRATFSATGFDAAAVTSMCLMLGAALRPPAQHSVRVIRVTFDRPFGFIAVDRSSRLVLFAGWVENPARHPDDEFHEAFDFGANASAGRVAANRRPRPAETVTPARKRSD